MLDSASIFQSPTMPLRDCTNIQPVSDAEDIFGPNRVGAAASSGALVGAEPHSFLRNVRRSSPSSQAGRIQRALATVCSHLGPGNHPRGAFEAAAGGIPLERALFLLNSSVSEPLHASPVTPGSDTSEVLVQLAAAGLTGIAAHQAGKKYLESLKACEGPPPTRELTLTAGHCAASLAKMHHIFPVKQATLLRLAAAELRALGRNEEENADGRERVFVGAMVAKQAQGRRLSVAGDNADVLVTVTPALPKTSARGGGGGGEFGSRSLQGAFASTVSKAVNVVLARCDGKYDRMALLAAETTSLLDGAVRANETAAELAKSLKAQLGVLKSGSATYKAELGVFAAGVDDLARGVLEVSVVGGRAEPGAQIDRRTLRALAIRFAPNLLRKMADTVTQTHYRWHTLERRDQRIEELEGRVALELVQLAGLQSRSVLRFWKLLMTALGLGAKCKIAYLGWKKGAMGEGAGVVSTRAYLKTLMLADLEALRALVLRDPRLLTTVYVDNLDLSSNKLEGPTGGHEVLHLAITGAMFENFQHPELSNVPTRFVCISGGCLVGRTFSTLAPRIPANNAVSCVMFKLPFNLNACLSELPHKPTGRPLWICSETKFKFVEIFSAYHVLQVLPEVLTASPNIRDPFHPELTEEEALQRTLGDAQRRLLRSAALSFGALTGIPGPRGYPPCSEEPRIVLSAWSRHNYPGRYYNNGRGERRQCAHVAFPVLNANTSTSLGCLSATSALLSEFHNTPTGPFAPEDTSPLFAGDEATASQLVEQLLRQSVMCLHGAPPGTDLREAEKLVQGLVGLLNGPGAPLHTQVFHDIAAYMGAYEGRCEVWKCFFGFTNFTSKSGQNVPAKRRFMRVLARAHMVVLMTGFHLAMPGGVVQLIYPTGNPDSFVEEEYEIAFEAYKADLAEFSPEAAQFVAETGRLLATSARAAAIREERTDRQWSLRKALLVDFGEQGKHNSQRELARQVGQDHLMSQRKFMYHGQGYTQSAFGHVDSGENIDAIYEESNAATKDQIAINGRMEQQMKSLEMAAPNGVRLRELRRRADALREHTASPAVPKEHHDSSMRSEVSAAVSLLIAGGALSRDPHAVPSTAFCSLRAAATAAPTVPFICEAAQQVLCSRLWEYGNQDQGCLPVVASSSLVGSCPLLVAGNTLHAVTVTLDPVFYVQAPQGALEQACRPALQLPPPPSSVASSEGQILPMWRLTGGGQFMRTVSVSAGEIAKWKLTPATSTPFGPTCSGRGLVVSAPPEADPLFSTEAGSVLLPRDALVVGFGRGWKFVPGRGFVPTDKDLDGRVPSFGQAKQALTAACAAAVKRNGSSGLVTVRLLAVGGAPLSLSEVLKHSGYPTALLTGVTSVVLHILAPGASIPRRVVLPTEGPEVAASIPAAAACEISSSIDEEAASSDIERNGGSGDEGEGPGNDDKKAVATTRYETRPAAMAFLEMLTVGADADGARASKLAAAKPASEEASASGAVALASRINGHAGNDPMKSGPYLKNMLKKWGKHEEAFQAALQVAAGLRRIVFREPTPAPLGSGATGPLPIACADGDAARALVLTQLHADRERGRMEAGLGRARLRALAGAMMRLADTNVQQQRMGNHTASTANAPLAGADLQAAACLDREIVACKAVIQIAEELESEKGAAIRALFRGPSGLRPELSAPQMGGGVAMDVGDSAAAAAVVMSPVVDEVVLFGSDGNE